METLPVLIYEQILGELSVEDLLACSRVSVAWRAMVNSNILWRKVCLKTSKKSTIEYVQSENSTVDPTFQELDSTTLEPLCPWRVVFMKLQHVCHNWRSGNHTCCRVVDDAGEQLVAVEKFNDTFVALEENGKCGVWSIRGVPRKLEDLYLAFSKTSMYECFIHLREEILVIVQDTLLQVYRKRNNSFQLSSRKLFNLAESFSDNIPTCNTVDEWYQNLRYRVNLTNSHAVTVIGKFFMGVNLIGKDSCCHVWDILKGCKLKEELIFNLHHEDIIDKIQLRSPRTYLDRILVIVHYHRKEVFINIGSNNDLGSNYFTIIYLYDFVTLTFKRLRVMNIVPWVFYEDTLFLTVDDNRKVLSTFNSSNGDIIFSTSFDGYLMPNSMQVEGDYLGCATSTGLIILDIKRNFEAVFKVSSKYKGYYAVSFIGWDLVLVSCYDGNNKIEVWSIKENKRLCSINVAGEIGACDNSTNLFICELGKGINVLKFW